MKKKLQLNKETMAVLNMSEMSKAIGQAAVECPPEGDDAQFPHEADCSLFYMCNHGTPILMQCPEGLHFNAAIGYCDFPENAGCGLTLASIITFVSAITTALSPTTVTLVSVQNTCPTCQPGKQNSCGLCS